MTYGWKALSQVLWRKVIGTQNDLKVETWTQA